MGSSLVRVGVRQHARPRSRKELGISVPRRHYSRPKVTSTRVIVGSHSPWRGPYLATGP